MSEITSEKPHEDTGSFSDRFQTHVSALIEEFEKHGNALKTKSLLLPT